MSDPLFLVLACGQAYVRFGCTGPCGVGGSLPVLLSESLFAAGVWAFWIIFIVMTMDKAPKEVSGGGGGSVYGCSAASFVHLSDPSFLISFIAPKEARRWYHSSMSGCWATFFFIVRFCDAFFFFFYGSDNVAAPAKAFKAVVVKPLVAGTGTPCSLIFNDLFF